MVWCPQGSSFTMWATDYPYVQIWNYCDEDYRATIGSSYWYGSTFPKILERQLRDYGDELRDFTTRDLFIKANSPRFEGAVFLAELGETITSIRELFVGCVKAFLKSGQAWKSAKHLALNAEELWLWWRYMLMPAMMDAEDIINALKAQDFIDRVQDGSRCKDPVKESGIFYSRRWGPSYTDVLEVPWRSETTWGTGGAIDILSSNRSSDFGLSPWDMIRGTWEYIPFSFIFDWFVNLGDWLASLRELEVVFAQSYATYAVDCTTELLPGTDVTLDFNPKCRSFLMSRVVDLEPPSLPLVDRRWRNTLRTIDSIALTIGMLKSILKKRRK
jgi:hypothetical protein